MLLRVAAVLMLAWCAVMLLAGASQVPFVVPTLLASRRAWLSWRRWRRRPRGRVAIA